MVNNYNLLFIQFIYLIDILIFLFCKNNHVNRNGNIYNSVILYFTYNLVYHFHILKTYIIILLCILIFISFL